MRIGIDIGGTKAVIAVVNENGEILKKERMSTGAELPCKEIVKQAAQIAKKLAEGEPIDFVGIGIPGTVDNVQGLVVWTPNLKWRNEPVAELFREETGVCPMLVQDTRAAAWAESLTPEMKDKSCVLCVTLGTGIGCGIVLNHRIWHGALGTAGEMGHIPVVKNGRVCGCGKHGCMEAYASGTGMAKTAKERGICETTEELFDLAKAGNIEAKQVISEAVDYAAQALSGIVNVLSPDAVLLSGGLCAQEELYVQPIIDKVKELSYTGAVGVGFTMRIASLGGEAPVIGAALLDK